MSENASNGASGAQPSQGLQVPANLLTGSKLTDFFLKGQTEAPAEEKPAQQFSKRPQSVTEAEAAQAAEAEPVDEGPINAQQASVQEETGEAEPAGETGVLDALPEGKGGKDAPFSVTDLPEDQYIELKLDGEKEVVSLRELANGHLRRKAFNRYTNQAKSAIEEAHSYAKVAVQERETVRQSLQAFLTNPQQMLEFMLENQPEVAEAFARGYAEVWDSWQKNPEARRRFEWDRQQRKIQTERAKLDQERQAHEKQMRETREAQAELERLKPVMQRAMREIGFPKITPKFRETVNLLCEAARRANGGKLDPDDLRDAVLQANKLHPAPSPVHERRPAPAPQAPPRPAAQPRKPNGQYAKDWNTLPYNRRMADPDFFLRKG